MEERQRNLFEVWKKITKYMIWKGVANWEKCYQKLLKGTGIEGIFIM